jgi:hypothetical protein
MVILRWKFLTIKQCDYIEQRNRCIEKISHLTIAAIMSTMSTISKGDDGDSPHTKYNHQGAEIIDWKSLQIVSVEFPPEPTGEWLYYV